MRTVNQFGEVMVIAQGEHFGELAEVDIDPKTVCDADGNVCVLGFVKHGDEVFKLELDKSSPPEKCGSSYFIKKMEQENPDSKYYEIGGFLIPIPLRIVPDFEKMIAKPDLSPIINLLESGAIGVLGAVEELKALQAKFGEKR